MRIVCISDTHERHDELVLPAGDILVHAGDFTFRGDRHAVEDFNAWLGTLPFKHKIVIAGNHELTFESDPGAYEPLITNALYLRDREVTVEGLRIYGSPWTPEFFDWAFMKKRGPELAAVWAGVPPGMDILVTHGPPMGIGDRLLNGECVGDAQLLDAIRVRRPRFHVCGHIHCGHGERTAEATRFINAAICDEAYRAVQAPIVIDA